MREEESREDVRGKGGRGQILLPDYVWMFQLLQNAYLSQSCTWNSLRRGGGGRSDGGRESDKATAA